MEVPLYIGSSDAAGQGMGGVWLPDADLSYLVAVRDNTLLLALHTKQGPAIAVVVATERLYMNSQR